MIVAQEYLSVDIWCIQLIIWVIGGGHMWLKFKFKYKFIFSLKSSSVFLAFLYTFQVSSLASVLQSELALWTSEIVHETMNQLRHYEHMIYVQL